MLKGQAREDFEKWFISYIDKQLAHNRDEWNEGEELLSNFYELPFSMQYGVLVDWFDSVGIDFGRNLDGGYWVYCRLTFETFENLTKLEQFEQANKIYNDRK